MQGEEIIKQLKQIKQLIARSPQKVELLGYWNGKSFDKVPELEEFIKNRQK